MANEQTDRQDPIGDLGQDVKDDYSLSNSVVTPKELKKHVECKIGSCYEAVQACIAEGKEYKIPQNIKLN